MPRAGVLTIAQQAHRVLRRNQHLQVSQRVPDFGPLVEAETAHHVVVDAVAPQRLFELARLRVGAVEDGDPGGRVFAQRRAGSCRRRTALPARRRPPRPGRSARRPLSSVHSHFPLRSVLCATRALARLQDVLGRAVVLLQADHARPRVVALEVQDVADVGPSPAVDGLVLVADHAHVLPDHGEQPHQLVLAAVGVLVLVDHQVLEAPVVGSAGQSRRAASRRTDSSSRSSKSSAFACRRLLSYSSYTKASRDGLGVGRGLVEVGGRLLVVLGEADPRQRRPVLHELLVQPQAAIDRLDHRQLVVLVVDGETGSETGPQIGQRRAIAAQQPHREGVEGREPGPRGAAVRPQQPQHPVAHLVGGLVGEGDRQNGVGWHSLHPDQAGNAVRDDPGLAAPGAGQDQDRAIRDGKLLHAAGDSGPQESPWGRRASRF